MQENHQPASHLTSHYANEHDVWKNFSEHKITHSIAHYLMAIDEASDNQEEGCKSVQVAKILGVSRNAVSLQLRSLQQHDLVTFSETKLIKLSKRGLSVVNNIVTARRSMKRFLVEFLGIAEDIAEKDSCKVEHLISQETRNALVKLMQFVSNENQLSDPFIQALKNYQINCEENKSHQCPICQHSCLLDSSNV